MRGPCDRIHPGHDGALGDRHQNDPIDRRPDGIDRAQQKTLDRGSEQTIADARHFSRQRVPIQIDEVQREQRKDQRHEAPKHLQPKRARQFHHCGARLRHRVRGRCRVSQLFIQLVTEPLPDPRELLHPAGYLRRPALHRLCEGVHQRDRLANGNESPVNDRKDQHDAQEGSERQRCPDVPVLAPETGEPAVVERRRRDRHDDGPAQRRQKVPQHPAAQDDEQPDQDVARRLLACGCVSYGHPPIIRHAGKNHAFCRGARSRPRGLTLAVELRHLRRGVALAGH